MPGYNSAISLHPDSSYGVVLFIGGEYRDAARLSYDVFDIMQPAFDRAHAEAVASLYTGKWASKASNSSASVVLAKGTLYIEHLILEGSDVLPLFEASGRLALRSSQRKDEFR